MDFELKIAGLSQSKN